MTNPDCENFIHLHIAPLLSKLSNKIDNLDKLVLYYQTELKKKESRLQLSYMELSKMKKIPLKDVLKIINEYESQDIDNVSMQVYSGKTIDGRDKTTEEQIAENEIHVKKLEKNKKKEKSNKSVSVPSQDVDKENRKPRENINTSSLVSYSLGGKSKKRNQYNKKGKKQNKTKKH